jgi:sulfate permease, SulP family
MTMSIGFRPKLFDALRDYGRTRFVHDLIAGMTVAIVALPLAMAFAIASGVKPQAGVFTAIIGGFLVSALGGSRVQIGGPAGAFIVVIYGIIERYGLANLLIATILAGTLLFALGVLRLGTLIRYIPVPVVIGFTNGIAVLIALSQVKELLGLDIEKMPGDFFAQIKVLAINMHSADLKTMGLALASLVIIFGWPLLFQVRPDDPEHMKHYKNRPVFRLFRAIPGTIVVLVAGTVAVSAFHLDVATIGSRFGGIPQSLPDFRLPLFTWELVKQLFAPTLTIALLAAIESLLCARVADNLCHDRHDPNQELMAQGIANMVVPFFGGIPVTGTIARTVTNIRSGGSTPVAGMAHAVSLMAIVLLAAPLAKDIPLASLAAILLFVAYNMGEWHEFRRLPRFAVNYRILVVATFLLTVILDLTVAVEAGLVLACLFFIYRISSLTRVEPLAPEEIGSGMPEGATAYAIFGSLFFGAIGKLQSVIESGTLPRRALILELHQLIYLDTTGLDALETLRKTLKAQGSHLILCGVNHQPLELMQQSGFMERLERRCCVETLAQAAALAADLPSRVAA